MLLRRLVFAAVVLVPLSSCSGSTPDLTEEGRVVATEQLVTLGAASGLMLDAEGAACSLDRLGQAEADLLAAGEALPSDALPATAEAIVDCVGGEMIAAELLASQAPIASEPELECASAAIDDSLVVALVLSSLEEEALSRPAVELAVASALALCLTPEHLLDQG